MRLLILFALTLPLALAAETSLSQAEQQKELERLQQEVQSLKAQLGQKSNGASAPGALKTEDLQGRTVDSLAPPAPQGDGGKAMPPEVNAELQKQLEKIKKARDESEQFFLEMDKETK